MIHYRKDNPNGITAPNPDAPRDKIEHITKCRGQKTPYTSVSEDRSAVRHFEGILYSTDSVQITGDGHGFVGHQELIAEIRAELHGATRARRVLATRALQLALKAREALVDWQFDLTKIERKQRVGWCKVKVDQYFTRC